MSGQLRLKRPFYDGLRQLLQKTVLSSYVLRRLARRKQLVDQILLLLHTTSLLSGMIVYTKLFTPSGEADFIPPRLCVSSYLRSICLAMKKTLAGRSARR